jgi:hypothetical protein
MRERTFKRYLFALAAATVAVLVVVGSLYVVTDPQGLIGTPRVAGLNAAKPYLEHNRELARWRIAVRACPTAGIFGNSRAEIGFDPDHSAFSALGLSAFNHAIPGTGIQTAFNQLSWLAAAGCAPKLIVVGVEFLDYLVDPRESQPSVDVHEQSPSPPAFGVQRLAESVFSISGLRDSFDTLLAQQRPYAAVTTEKGFNPLRNYIPEVQRTGQYVLFRQRAEANLRALRTQSRSVLDAGGVPSSEFRVLQSLLALARKEHCRVVLVIYPYHAQLRLLFDSLGYTDSFEGWKRRVVSIANEASNTNPEVNLWDFSLISEVTTEPIPAAGDKRHMSFGYWEGGHFKRQLGDQMLDQMLLGENGFGVLLSPQILESILARDRERLAELLRGSPVANDVAEILAVMKKNSE